MHKYKGKLLRVIDGDTIEVAVFLGFNISVKKKIRLARIDTAELRSPIKEQRDLAHKAKKRLSELFVHNDVEIQTHGFDKYGRCIADVLIGGINVSDVLLKEGLAKKYE